MSETLSAAGSRINALLDANSFVEIGGLVTARATDFNLSARETPSDGVITGYGTIDGSLVYIYSQDVTVLNGTVGEMHAKKIARVYALAEKTGAPVIGLLDCGGLRLEESTDALDALGLIMRNQAAASGLVPQITVVCGNAGGGLSVVTALSDFTFAVADKGRVFVNSPDAIPGNNVDKKDTSAPEFQYEAGNVDFVGSEDEVVSAVRKLVGLLPLNNQDEGTAEDCADDLNRVCAGLAGTITDAAETLRVLGDGGQFFETKAGYAADMVTGFIRLNGYTVGAVANRGTESTLRARDAEKAASFINFCDAFNIPVLTLANVSGFHACKCSERRIPRESASLAYAYASATVPKVTVVTGKAIGSAGLLMGSKSIGADMVYAWPDAEIGAMEAPMAAKIIAAEKSADELKKTEEEYSALQLNASSAARRGYVDTIIADEDTRKYVIGAFEMLYTKREDRPDKKHGTV